MSFQEVPPLGAVLYGIEVPRVGGDTMLANMYLAYETLSKGMTVGAGLGSALAVVMNWSPVINRAL
jgi:alpha-ketoglutarate-dependent taurine dioxygenase